MKLPSVLKLKYFIISFLIVTNISNSQILQINILDTHNQYIANANILVKEGEDPNLIKEFGLARNGIAKINLKNNYQKILIEVNAYNYFKKTYVIENPQKNRTYIINFILKKDKITKLDEVIIRAKKRPFSIKKDTVIYNVNSYRDGSERKIQDLIKKLPGIEVNTSTGEIRYKGKSVETVLLEGDNLFGYNYSLGTKNINVDMVEQVQAIENYSENPLLKGIENGNKVALNLTLKKGKIDFSGNLDLGLGIFKKRKKALNINANILGITKNYKSFATLAYNNIGINNSSFDYFGLNMSLETQKEKDYYAQKIIPETSFSNILDNNRVTINNQYFGNYNAILKINKRLKIKTNLYYLNDKITSKQLFENMYFINDEYFITSDNTFITKKPRQYRGNIELKYNSSKTSLLEYNARVRQENIKTPSTVISNNENSFESFLITKDFYLKQKLLFTKKISNLKAFQFSVFQSTNTIPQTYLINPSAISTYNFDRNTQKTENRKDYLKIQATFLGSSQKGSKYTFLLGRVIDNNKLKSNLLNKNLITDTTTEKSINDSRYNSNSIYQLGAYHYKAGKWNFSPTYVLSYLSRKIENRVNDAKNKQFNFIFEPSLKIRYRLNSISFLSAKAGYNKNSEAEKYLLFNDILIDNRTTVSNTSSLRLQEITNYGIYYFNNNLYNQFLINLGVNYQKTIGNFFTNSLVNKNTIQINYFYLPQDNSNLSFNFKVSKYIPFLETTIRLNSNYNLSKYKNIVNNSELRNSRSQFFNASLFAKTAFDGFINLENSINYAKSFSQSQDNPQFSNESLNNSFKIILKPSKKSFVLISLDYFLPNKNKKSEKYIFLDTTLRYRPLNKNLEFNFVAKNLLNNNNFKQIETTDFSTIIYKTNILPRYFLINVSYNL
ncbi:MAG: hypothetical protein QM486_01705 [Flavobacteriaceae bacterium]